MGIDGECVCDSSSSSRRLFFLQAGAVVWRILLVFVFSRPLVQDGEGFSLRKSSMQLGPFVVVEFLLQKQFRERPPPLGRWCVLIELGHAKQYSSRLLEGGLAQILHENQ